MKPLTPKQIVAALDLHIVGQAAAKKSVAIALRNRWRRQQLPEPFKQDSTPKKIRMSGPSGGWKIEETDVDIQIEQKQTQVTMLGLGQMESDLQTVIEKMMPKSSATRKLPVKEARKVLLEQESETLIDKQVVIETAIKLVENQ